MVGWTSCVAPLWVAAVKSVGYIACLAEPGDGGGGHDAVGAAAVGDDVGVGWEFVDAVGEVGDGDVDGSVDVSGGVFAGWAHVDEHGAS